MRKSIVFLSMFLLIWSTGLADSKIKISTSIFPLKEFAEAVAEERGEVTLLLPPGADVHTWKPKPSDMIRLSHTDLFLYIGADLEPWIDNLLKGVQNPGLNVLEASKNLDLHEKGHTHEYSQKIADPHVWLDFEKAQHIVKRIALELSKISPEDSSKFMNNADEYKKRLVKLDQIYSDTFKNCEKRILIFGGHSAFGYLADRYGLQQISLYGINPNSRPSPKTLMKVVETARTHQVKVIFFETHVSDDLARVIAKEVNAGVLILNPGANLTKKEIESGITFFDIMKKNLENLKNGLGC